MEIKDVNGMKGLFSSKTYHLGETVCIVEGEIINQPTRTSVQIAKNIHVNVKSPIQYINHSCHGNISLKNNTFVANRPIEAGEEITFNYLETEDSLSNPFVCRDCGGRVKGKSFDFDQLCILNKSKEKVNFKNIKSNIVNEIS